MAYSEQLAQKVRSALAHIEQVEEKKMFGGLAFLVNGKMCINAGADRLMFRVDPALPEDVVNRNGSEPVFMQGRPYKGYFYVPEDGISTDQDFDHWLGLALDFNARAKASSRRKRQ